MTRIGIVPVAAAELARVQTLAHEIWPEAFAGILPAGAHSRHACRDLCVADA